MKLPINSNNGDHSSRINFASQFIQLPCKVAPMYVRHCIVAINQKLFSLSVMVN